MEQFLAYKALCCDNGMWKMSIILSGNPSYLIAVLVFRGFYVIGMNDWQVHEVTFFLGQQD